MLLPGWILKLFFCSWSRTKENAFAIWVFWCHTANILCCYEKLLICSRFGEIVTWVDSHDLILNCFMPHDVPLAWQNSVHWMQLYMCNWNRFFFLLMSSLCFSYFCTPFTATLITEVIFPQTSLLCFKSGYWTLEMQPVSHIKHI